MSSQARLNYDQAAELGVDRQRVGGGEQLVTRIVEMLTKMCHFR